MNDNHRPIRATWRVLSNENTQKLIGDKQENWGKQLKIKEEKFIIFSFRAPTLKKSVPVKKLKKRDSKLPPKGQ